MGLDAALAPLDLRAANRRFETGWGVLGHITLESELWPNRITRMPGPVMVLGGRLTEGSARIWGRFPALAARMLGAVDYLSAQDEGSRTRFLALGLPPDAAGPVTDLKALYAPPVAPAPDPSLGTVYPRAKTWLAASTHAGEEEAVIEAHLAARETDPDLRLILAPRHPRRAPEVAALLEAAGLAYAQRSKGEPVEPETDVYVADTLGEMGLWYSTRRSSPPGSKTRYCTARMWPISRVPSRGFWPGMRPSRSRMRRSWRRR